MVFCTAARRAFVLAICLTVCGSALGADYSVQTAVNTPVLIGHAAGFTSVAGATHGSVALNGTTFVYTPTSRFTGSDTLSYVANDSTGSIVVTVIPSVTS